MGNVSWSGSYQCSQNGRLRPTRFSHVRLCDSLTPSDGALSSGVRRSESAIPCAYSPWPASWSVDQTDSRSSGWYRVVRRTSRFVKEVQNGCAVGSSRQAPLSKPSVATTRSANARCSSGGKAPRRNEASTSGADATISVSAGRSTANTSRTSVVSIPGS